MHLFYDNLDQFYFFIRYWLFFVGLMIFNFIIYWIVTWDGLIIVGFNGDSFKNIFFFLWFNINWRKKFIFTFIFTFNFIFINPLMEYVLKSFKMMKIFIPITILTLFSIMKFECKIHTYRIIILVYLFFIFILNSFQFYENEFEFRNYFDLLLSFSLLRFFVLVIC